MSLEKDGVCVYYFNVIFLISLLLFFSFFILYYISIISITLLANQHVNTSLLATNMIQHDKCKYKHCSNSSLPEQIPKATDVVWMPFHRY